MREFLVALNAGFTSIIEEGLTADGGGGVVALCTHIPFSRGGEGNFFRPTSRWRILSVIDW